MADATRPSLPHDWRSSVRQGELGFRLTSGVLLLAYVLGVVRPEADEGMAILMSLVAMVVLVSAAVWRSDRMLLAPVRDYFAAAEAGEAELSSEKAFAAVMAYPARFSAHRMLCWLAGAVVLGVAMTLQGYSSWLFGARFEVLILCALGGVCCGCAFAYFGARAAIAPARRYLRSTLPDPQQRRALTPRLSIGTKLQLAFVSAVAGWLILGLGASQWMMRGRVEEGALAWQARLLDEIATQGTPVGLEKELDSVLDTDRTHLIPVAFSQRDVSDSLLRPWIRAALEAREMRGGRHDYETGALISWQRTGGGKVLVARTTDEELASLVASSLPSLAMLLGIALAGGFGVAWLLARDVRGVLGTLVEDSQRIASGDLRDGVGADSDDELMDVACAFDGMRLALRETVVRMAQTAEHVDVTVAGITAVGREVSDASAQQGGRTRDAGVLMDRINAQVSGITRSAQGLGESVEESGSSILELGAASEELNETASVLSEKIESVSSSIEQMTRSVQQVSQNTGGLADAANDTSARMEEMSSEMRVVDTTAGRTVTLSTEVVEAAERGQEKVRQTIEGMHAIQDATDAAEKVIRGLGTRAQEIDAILDVIEDVGDETTLLALNAAIIAAQSGEHGRAFSVVADEIKELAERVLASAKEIGGLIRSVQGEVGNAIGAIEAGSNSVASGVDLSAEAGSALEEITSAARESGSRISQIVSAVREQADAAVGVVELMDRVRDGVIEIRAAGVEQGRGHDVVLQSSLAIRDVAQQVRRTTEEQTAGFARIRVSVETVQDAAERINGSLSEQVEACGDVARFIDEVAERTQANEIAMGRISETVDALSAHAESLREDMTRFQV